MRFLLIACLVVLSGFASVAGAQNRDFGSLFRSFDANELTSTDRRFLQAALAFEGYYLGLLDGDWGKLSQRALSDYSFRKFGTPSEDWHMAVLAFGFLDQYEKEGWDMTFYPGLGMSILVPTNAIAVDEPTANFANFRHRRSTLSYSIGVHSIDKANAFHRFTLDRHTAREEPYTVRKKNFAVSTAKDGNGTVLYTRSNFVNGAWSTIMLSAQERDETTLNAVTSSIAVGRAADLDIASYGKLNDVLETALALAFAEDAERPAKTETGNTPKVNEAQKEGGSIGSGFVVSKSGHILTNAHVVENCGTVLVDGRNANVVNSSTEYDLAILKTELEKGKKVADFALYPANLNSDVTAVGFPLAGLLGGLNVTRGSVSSLKGLGGDGQQMQITAPVQSGNSGGPLIAANGGVVGVVVAKLNAQKVAELTGDLPQNINFAVRGEIAKLYLSQNQIQPKLKLDQTRLSPEDLAKQAANFTAFVECK